ncbi:MFS transporter [Microbacterium oxydans]|uniref:MFS transporter n=1 Tax=Microbacterium oxydans TaxID=82380 RepID=UPI003628E38A
MTDNRRATCLWPAATLLWALQFSVFTPILAALLVSLYGATASQVGLSLVAYNVGGFVASVIVPGWADRVGNYLVPLLVCSVCGVAMMAVLALTTSLPIAIVALVVLGGPASVGSTLLFAHLGHRGASPVRVIRTRAIVSVAWVVGPPLATLSLSGGDDRAALIVLAGIVLMTVATSLVLVRSEKGTTSTEGPRRIPVPGQLRGWGRWCLMSAFAGLHATNVATVSTIVLFITHELHAPIMWAGIILGTCALLEVPSLVLIGHLLPRFGARALLFFACGVGVLYYGLAAMVSVPWQLLILQVLNAWFFATVAGVGLTVFQTVFPSPGLAAGLFTNTRRVGAVLSGVLIAGVASLPNAYQAVYGAAALLVLIVLLSFAALSAGRSRKDKVLV